uniref:Uncharacterized protein n=1 Tax=Syphacia muris TaxID=451379 RepID=A0A0N5AEG9_9BILA
MTQKYQKSLRETARNREQKFGTEYCTEVSVRQRAQRKLQVVDTIDNEAKLAEYISRKCKICFAANKMLNTENECDENIEDFWLEGKEQGSIRDNSGWRLNDDTLLWIFEQ